MYSNMTPIPASSKAARWSMPGFHGRASVEKETRTIGHDGYTCVLTILKPVSHASQTRLLPAFLFIPPPVGSEDCRRCHEKILADLATASGRAAVTARCSGSSPLEIPVFELFAALKWMSCFGEEVGLLTNNFAVVGVKLGANVAAVLSQMALADTVPDIRQQILIDPQFFISKRQDYHRPMASRVKDDDDHRKWVTPNDVYNLPLNAKLSELGGIPPTLIQLSANSGSYCELEYYCTKLIQAGVDVTYDNYDGQDEPESGFGGLQLSADLLKHTAARMRNPFSK